MARLPIDHQPKYQQLLDRNRASIQAQQLTHRLSARKNPEGNSDSHTLVQLY